MSKRKEHGNSKQSRRIHHIYEIIDTKENDVFKYGICGRDLNEDGSSKRANAQVKLFNRVVGWARFVAKVIVTGIKGRKKAAKLEKEKIQKYRQTNGQLPRGNQ